MFSYYGSKSKIIKKYPKPIYNDIIEPFAGSSCYSIEFGKDKNVCIMDDMVSTGGTVVHAIKHLKSLGAKKIVVATVHGIFAGNKIAEKILKAGCQKIFVTDSIPNEYNKNVQVVKLPEN